jgi:glucoamylase
MPLVWAHAEYIKLLRSLKEERVFDLPSQTVERYLTQAVSCTRSLWRFNHKCRAMAAGNLLRIETLAAATIHWTCDGWRTTHDTASRSTGLGVHVADLATAECRAGDRLCFTFYWHESARWEGTDFEIDVL